MRLIVANVALFFLQSTVEWVTEAFAFVPRLILIRPWTLITYMFMHGGLGHIFWNMLGLFFFGPRVESRLGSKQFITMYFIAGITGALLSFAMAPSSPIVGASAGIFGVMMAFAYFWPRDRIYIWGVLPVEARWLVVLTTIFALYSGLGGSRGGVADFAHLGGYLGAYLYLRYIGSNPAQKKFRKRVFGHVEDTTLQNWKKVDPTRIHALNRDEVNRILDKISEQGIESLTPQERLFLSNFVPLDDRKPPVS